MKITCKTCRFTMDETEFHKNTRSPTGRKFHCRKCIRHSLQLRVALDTEHESSAPKWHRRKLDRESIAARLVRFPRRVV